MNKKFLMATGAVAIAVGVFLFAGGTDKDVLTEEGTVNIKQLVNDYSTGIITDESASITSEQLIVTRLTKRRKSMNYPKMNFLFL